MTEVLTFIANHVFGIILAGVAIYILAWYRNYKDERKQLNVDTVNLLGRKISLETKSKPLDELIADSNTQHGTSADGPAEVLPPSGSSSKIK